MTINQPEDIICNVLLLEEGLLLHRIFQQNLERPDESPALSLVALPFLALIEHDAIPYLEKKYGVSLPHESSELRRTRNLTKSLDSKYLKYEQYTKEAQRNPCAHFRK